MSNVGFSAACIEARHEAEEAAWENALDAAGDTFASCLAKRVVIRYKTDPAPTIEDAEQIFWTFTAALGEPVSKRLEFIYDAKMDNGNDTDWQITGVDEPALDAVNQICEAVFCDKADATYCSKLIDESIAQIAREYN